jgi:hypothetical protein
MWIPVWIGFLCRIREESSWRHATTIEDHFPHGILQCMSSIFSSNLPSRGMPPSTSSHVRVVRPKDAPCIGSHLATGECWGKIHIGTLCEGGYQVKSAARMLVRTWVTISPSWARPHLEAGFESTIGELLMETCGFSQIHKHGRDVHVGEWEPTTCLQSLADGRRRG